MKKINRIAGLATTLLIAYAPLHGALGKKLADKLQAEFAQKVANPTEHKNRLEKIIKQFRDAKEAATQQLEEQYKKALARAQAGGQEEQEQKEAGEAEGKELRAAGGGQMEQKYAVGEQQQQQEQPQAQFSQAALSLNAHLEKIAKDIQQAEDNKEIAEAVLELGRVQDVLARSKKVTSDERELLGARIEKIRDYAAKIRPQPRPVAPMASAPMSLAPEDADDVIKRHLDAGQELTKEFQDTFRKNWNLIRNNATKNDLEEVSINQPDGFVFSADNTFAIGELVAFRLYDDNHFHKGIIASNPDETGDYYVFFSKEGTHDIHIVAPENIGKLQKRVAHEAKAQEEVAAEQKEPMDLRGRIAEIGKVVASGDIAQVQEQLVKIEQELTAEGALEPWMDLIYTKLAFVERLLGQKQMAPAAAVLESTQKNVSSLNKQKKISRSALITLQEKINSLRGQLTAGEKSKKEAEEKETKSFAQRIADLRRIIESGTQDQAASNELDTIAVDLSSQRASLEESVLTSAWLDLVNMRLRLANKRLQQGTPEKAAETLQQVETNIKFLGENFTTIPVKTLQDLQESVNFLQERVKKAQEPAAATE